VPRVWFDAQCRQLGGMLGKSDPRVSRARRMTGERFPPMHPTHVLEAQQWKRGVSKKKRDQV
jgi:hypothetical protein